MSNRAIPVEVTRQLLIESGHRCAVCGAPSPLERAHIVPFQKEGSSRYDNLICLCANCHVRADIERWSSEILRSYKERPWVARHSKELTTGKEKTQVEMRIELSGQDLADDQTRQRLERAIAAFLDVEPQGVRIISTKDVNDESNR
jgi:type I restriction enzyme R subunit